MSPEKLEAIAAILDDDSPECRASALAAVRATSRVASAAARTTTATRCGPCARRAAWMMACTATTTRPAQHERADTLAFGYKRNIPEGVKALWGARAIYPNDVVWDRTDTVGEQADKEDLLAWLNGEVKTEPWDTAMQMAASGWMTQDSEDEFVLYQDALGAREGQPAGVIRLPVRACLPEAAVMSARTRTCRATIIEAGSPGVRYGEPRARLEDGRLMPMGWNSGQSFPIGTTGTAGVHPHGLRLAVEVHAGRSDVMPVNEDTPEMMALRGAMRSALIRGPRPRRGHVQGRRPGAPGSHQRPAVEQDRRGPARGGTAMSRPDPWTVPTWEGAKNAEGIPVQVVLAIEQRTPSARGRSRWAGASSRCRSRTTWRRSP